MRLQGKVALITGSALGIGKAVAARFGAEGARVAMVGNDRESLESAAAEINGSGGDAIAVCADVRHAEEVAGMLQSVLDAWGSVDILVNNAGICKPAPFLTLSEADWDLHMDVNLKGTFLVGQAVSRAMVKQGGGGSIINMSSVNGLAAEADQAHYNASKGGINLLTMSMALELAPHGIRVNAICPGLIETRLTAPLVQNAEALAPYLRTIPMGRVGQPDEIADAALFLASADARYMTGHCLVVDGGQVIKLS